MLSNFINKFCLKVGIGKLVFSLLKVSFVSRPMLLPVLMCMVLSLFCPFRLILDVSLGKYCTFLLLSGVLSVL